MIDAEHARSRAGRRANATGELWKIVGWVQAIERVTPVATIDKIVPLWNQVIDRAAGSSTVNDLAGMTERHPAVHTASALLSQMRLRHMVVKLLPIKHTFRRRPSALKRTSLFHDAC